ncbi:MAG: tetratricopeptide repeat protein [Methylophilaceae bacterium]|nr:tetratricopeptide repeat protein [Methyloradius sp.]
MALDLEEQEQLDALKTWWSTYGNLLTSALLVIVLALVAYKGWAYYQHKQSTEASAKYEALIKLDPKDSKEIQAISADLMDHYASTPYAGRAALTVAVTNLTVNDTKSAKAQFAWAAENAKETQIQAIANLQLAGIQFEEKSYDEALKTLAIKHDEGFDGLYADLKGDILVAQNKKDEARTAYQEALSKLDAEGRYYHFTEHKLESLGS